MPVPLVTTSVAVARVRCLYGPDRVGRGTKIMLGHTAYAGSLAGGVGRVAGGPAHRASSTHRVSTARASGHHLDFAGGPGASRGDGVARSHVGGLVVVKQIQHVVGASGGPDAQEPMIGIGQCAPTGDRDQARITVLGQDHPDHIATYQRQVSKLLTAQGRFTRRP